MYVDRQSAVKEGTDDEDDDEGMGRGCVNDNTSSNVNDKSSASARVYKRSCSSKPSLK